MNSELGESEHLERGNPRSREAMRSSKLLERQEGGIKMSHFPVRSELFDRPRIKPIRQVILAYENSSCR